MAASHPLRPRYGSVRKVIDALDPTAALAAGEAILAGRAEEPLLVVRADGSSAYDRLINRAGLWPCVVVVVGDAESVPAAGDVALAEAPNPPGPWVGGLDDVAWASFAERVRSRPGAAIVLVQLLRMSSRLPVADALTAESIAYGLLQASPEHRAWLEQPESGRSERATARGRVPADAEPVTIRRDGSTLVIDLNRPEMRNAYNARARDLLVEALEVASHDGSICEIHLHGEGSAFCSGGDLTEFGSVPDPLTGHMIRATRSVGRLLAELSSRVTAHVHGACVGAGVELAAFAGRVEAQPDAVFALPELAMGLIPGAGGTVSIPRRIGRQRACWLALTGNAIDAAQGLAWGLVDEIGR
jgi:Enoyl-CoA hydratase/isomerase